MCVMRRLVGLPRRARVWEANGRRAHTLRMESVGGSLRRRSLSSSSTSGSLLSSGHSQVLADERKLLIALHLVLAQGLDAPREQLDLLKDLQQRLDDIFIIPVVGEFNAGKSSFINALLGKQVVKTGVLPTTSTICLIKGASTSPASAASAPPASWLLDDVQEMVLPASSFPWSHTAILDTPGTNALTARHEALTTSIIPRADLVLFVTSAERPMSESETKFLNKICQWGKKIVVILNKIDVLSTDDEKQRVVEYVRLHVTSTLSQYGHANDLQIFPVSSRQALEAKLVAGTMDPALGPSARQWEQSGMRQLEEHMRGVLGREDLVASKLSTPLGVADRLITEALSAVTAQAQALESDQRVLEMIDQNQAAFEAEILRDARYLRQSVSELVLRTMLRADSFLERKVSIFSPGLLLDAAALQREFDQDVLADIRRPMEDLVRDIGDLVQQRCKAQASAVVQFVGNQERRGMVGKVAEAQPSSFESARLTVLDRLRIDTTQILEKRNLKQDSAAMSQAIHSAALQTAGVQGVAALTAVLAAVSLIDVTGLFAGAVTGTLGLAILPFRKSQARAALEDKVTALKVLLDSSIEHHVERELLGRVSELIKSSISPYRRFVTIEADKNAALEKQLVDLRQVAREIKTRLGK